MDEGRKQEGKEKKIKKILETKKSFCKKEENTTLKI